MSTDYKPDCCTWHDVQDCRSAACCRKCVTFPFPRDERAEHELEGDSGDTIIEPGDLQPW